jgi:type III secretion protein J
MKIDGVIAAKVHIALPNNDPLSDNSTPASASVFIKFRAGYDVESSTPDLKNLVTNSVEGLTFDKVELIMSPADAIPPPPKTEAQGANGVLAEWQAKLPPWGIPAASAGGGFLIAAIFFAALRSKKPA